MDFILRSNITTSTKFLVSCKDTWTKRAPYALAIIFDNIYSLSTLENFIWSRNEESNLQIMIASTWRGHLITKEH